MLDPRRAGTAGEAGPEVAGHDLPDPLRREEPETPRAGLRAGLHAAGATTGIEREELDAAPGLPGYRLRPYRPRRNERGQPRDCPRVLLLDRRDRRRPEPGHRTHRRRRGRGRYGYSRSRRPTP